MGADCLLWIRANRSVAALAAPAAFLQQSDIPLAAPAAFLQQSDIPTNRPFRLRCTCSYPLQVPSSAKTPATWQVPNRCSVDSAKLSVKQAAGSALTTALTEETLRRNLGNPKLLLWVRGSMSHFGLVDGRDAAPKIGSLGGDLGEFLFALAGWENVVNSDPARVTKRYLSEAEVETWLRSHLRDRQGKLSFSYATDKLRLGGALDGSGAQTSDVLDRPSSPEVRRLLASRLNLWQYQGAEFWKMVIQGNLDTGIRPPLAMHAVRAFFRTMWQQHERRSQNLTIGGVPLRLQVLDGRTRYLDRGMKLDPTDYEAAWLNVRTKPACNEHDTAPVVSSEGALGARYYVYHPDHVARQRKAMAVDIADNVLDDPEDPDLIVDEMNTFSDTIKKLMLEHCVRPAWDANREEAEWDVTLQQGLDGKERTDQVEYPR